ncbi:hypothetical protein [Desulfosporosinus fructosivorans]
MNQTKTFSISWDNGISVESSLSLTPIYENIYRLEDTPAFFDGVTMGDVIEANVGLDDILNFIKVVEKSNWNRFSWVLSKEFIDSTFYQQFTQFVLSEGGKWELIFGHNLIHSSSSNY